MNSLMIKCFALGLAVLVPVVGQQFLRFWCFECRSGKCDRVQFKDPDLQHPVGLSACRLSCGGDLGTVWPKLSGPIEFNGEAIISRNMKFLMPSNSKAEKLWQASKRRFDAQLSAKVPDQTFASDSGKRLSIRISISEAEDAQPDLTYDTDESYTLTINTSAVEATVVIEASNYFGARHGLETLSQLIVFDEIRHTFVTLANGVIHDRPKYKHRGLMLDTASNYFSKRSIEKTIDAMAMVKLNRFHWHIVDSSSFPLVIKSQPDLHSIGAYSPWKIYTHEDVIDLVKFAQIRGVRIYPELDFPAHADEGWQLKTCTFCLNNRSDPCLPPPWGQLDPTNDETFFILDDIYREVFDIFDPDMFHMGGSQVNLDVWIKSKVFKKWLQDYIVGIENEVDVKQEALNLWSLFHVKALLTVEKASKYENASTILWTTALPMLQNILHLNKSRVILQVADTMEDLNTFLKHGYRVVVSSINKLFFGCDYTLRSNKLLHCSPSIDWRTVYENRYDDIPENRHDQILGAEAVLYSKFSDESNVGSRLWPRLSALAERLWSNPLGTWRLAEARMLLHRQRLIENGVAAEALQPEWCLQNQNKCDRL